MLKYITLILLFIYGFFGYQNIMYADKNTDKIIAQLIAEWDKELLKIKKESAFVKSNMSLYSETVKIIYFDVKKNKVNALWRKSLIKRVQRDLLKNKEFEDYSNLEYGSKYCSYYEMLWDLYENLNVKNSGEISETNRIMALSCYEGYWWQLWEADKSTFWWLSLLLDLYTLNINLWDYSKALNLETEFNNYFLDAIKNESDTDENLGKLFEIFETNTDNLQILMKK